jgi:uncharacterized protein YpuA (DUF1002 family)
MRLSVAVSGAAASAGVIWSLSAVSDGRVSSRKPDS